MNHFYGHKVISFLSHQFLVTNEIYMAMSSLNYVSRSLANNTVKTAVQNGLGNENVLLQKTKQKLNKGGHFITSDTVAASVVLKMDLDFKDSCSTVIEFSPGPGYITHHLLQAGSRKLVAFEPHAHHLKLLVEKYGQHKVQYYNKDFMKLSQMHAFGLENEISENDNVVKYSCLKDCRQWESEPVVHVVGVTATSNSKNRYREIAFLKCLQHQISCQESLFTFGRPEFYLFVSPEEYRKMVLSFPCNNFHYLTPDVIFYKLFFDIKLLDQISKKHFEPKLSMESNKKGKNMNLDKSCLYFVHMKPKKTLFQDIGDTYHTQAFMFFVGQLLASHKKWKVIPRMELWAPNIGIELIKQGMKMHTRTGDLLPEVWLQLFKVFVNSQQYHESSFKTEFEDQRLKITDAVDNKSEDQRLKSTDVIDNKSEN